MKYILKMNDNRVRRNYTGGKLIEEIKGNPSPEDSDKPEEWLCSTVVAKNPGLPDVENEGLSYTTVSDRDEKLIDVLNSNKAFYLGSADSPTFLTKWIDSKIRLHVQAHPTREFSKKYLNTDYGKFECYYIMKARDEVKEPYIRLGFQNCPSKDEWKQIIENQDMEKMDATFEKIPVSPGDVVFIPGGIPHAIGEGLLLLEIMEPSDLVVRCEFEREGIVVPPEARFMKKGLDFCLDVFDYTQNSKQDIIDKYFVKPEVLIEKDEFTSYKMLDSSISGCFDLERINIKKNCTIDLDSRYCVAVVTSGKGQVKYKDEVESFKKLDNFFLAAEQSSLSVDIEGDDVELCLIYPPTK